MTPPFPLFTTTLGSPLGKTCRMRALTALITKVTDLYVDDCLIQTTIPTATATAPSLLHKFPSIVPQQEEVQRRRQASSFQIQRADSESLHGESFINTGFQGL